MRTFTKVALAFSVFLASVTPSLAAFWDCVYAPEIDGPAGLSAVAALIAISMIAYQRYRQ